MTPTAKVTTANGAQASTHNASSEKRPHVPYAIVLAIAGLPRSPNAIRGHWASNAKRIKAWRAAVVRAVELNGGPPAKPLERAAITFTRHSSVEPDHDNSVAACKPLLDGLRDAGVIIDDKKRNVGAPEYLWAKAPPKRGRVVIEVREVSGE